VEETVFVKPVYDQVLILRMLLTTLKDVTQRAKVVEHIRALRAGGVMLLLKAIYGLKQAPRAWWLQLYAFLKSLGFVANKCDVCFYILKLAGVAYVLLLLYVDDIILVTTTPALVKHYVGLISKRFKPSCEGPLDRYLGFKIGIDLPRRRASLCMSGVHGSGLHQVPYGCQAVSGHATDGGHPGSTGSLRG
jgi:hypothetical protein